MFTAALVVILHVARSCYLMCYYSHTIKKLHFDIIAYIYKTTYFILRILKYHSENLIVYQKES